MNVYKSTTPLQTRITKSKYAFKNYNDRYPVVIQKHYKDKNLPDIDHIKFLVPENLDYNSLLMIIRKRLVRKLPPDIALFLLTEKGGLVTGTEKISQVYSDHYDKEDGLLYLFYCSENTFG